MGTHRKRKSWEEKVQYPSKMGQTNTGGPTLAAFLMEVRMVRGKPVSPEETNQWVTAYLSGVSLSKIARLAKRDRQTVRDRVAGVGIDVPSREFKVVPLPDWDKLLVEGHKYHVEEKKGGAHAEIGSTNTSYILPKRVIYTGAQRGGHKTHYKFRAENGHWTTTFTPDQLIGYRVFPVR